LARQDRSRSSIWGHTSAIRHIL